MDDFNGLQPDALFWFRRDLRLEDNVGLYEALKNHQKVLPVFIFDSDILDRLEDKNDRRVEFIHQRLEDLQQKLVSLGSTLLVCYGKPQEIWEKLSKLKPKAVYANHDYEPYAVKRDEQVQGLLSDGGIAFRTFKGHVILEKDEVLKDDGRPYSVFTPYSRRWRAKLTADHLRNFPTENFFNHLLITAPKPIVSLSKMGFKASGIAFPQAEIKTNIVSNYTEQRNLPAIEGTSRLGIHLRFGTISIRKLARETQTLNDTFLSELIWRDFYAMILWQHPRVVDQAFKPRYDQIPWRNNELEFEAWCKGQTGYPIVDAGMRELNTTGFMHNRVRMITASFLVKHLLIDWRWGEAYFAQKLLDFDLASNNGGWQWASGSGCDAAPYFRVFSPDAQTKKFDPKLAYIAKWVPEFQDLTYARPIVDHKFGRLRAIETYKKALN